MLIQAGFTIGFQCPAWTPMLLQLNVHPSRTGDLALAGRDPFRSAARAMSAYLDHYGNRVTRVDVPPGLVTFHNRFMIQDSGLPDEIPPDTELTPIARLPDDVLLFLVSSRYCDSDNLADFAWSKFQSVAGGYARVKAICDFVHAPYPVQLCRRARDAHRQRRHARRHRRLPRFRPPRRRALPLHEHPRALLHRLSRRHRRPRRRQSRWISAPGSRCSSTGAGTRWTRATTIPASAAS